MFRNGAFIALEKDNVLFIPVFLLISGRRIPDTGCLFTFICDKIGASQVFEMGKTKDGNT